MGSLNKVNIVAISSAALLGLAYIISSAYRRGQRSVSPRNDRKVKKKALENDNAIEEENMSSASSQCTVLQPIGQVSSVYRLCVGTPRQGMLSTITF